MDYVNPPSQSVFSLSDQVLADRLQFIEEIGFGNWGSVWLCHPKPDPSSKSSSTKYQNVKIAVKLVHRAKTSTTAARVKSLWNEMKIVRSLKTDFHPSVIPFYSFIITPSYALITMPFLPRLVPVEVAEPISKRWFRSLVSGVEFLHKRGVVHNDIKPANILLSEEDIPVLVDFGFAEKYEETSKRAFKSNLAYGTPEYLSPERARGLYHDTRKSDIWSLGITFFEILVGRTPFEYVEGEEFSTKEDLQKYWARTNRGKWVGSWKMSKSVEKMLRRMIAPNADVRYTAIDVLEDPYWVGKEPPPHTHRKSSSLSQTALSAINIDMDTSKLLEIVSPFTTRTLKEKKNHVDKNRNKENVLLPSTGRKVDKSAIKIKQEPNPTSVFRGKHARSQSQSQLQPSGALNQANITPGRSTASRPLAFSPLAPIRGSTTSNVNAIRGVKVVSAANKENSVASPKTKLAVTSPKTKQVKQPSEGRTRKPAGPRKAPVTLDRQQSPVTQTSSIVDSESAHLPKLNEDEGAQTKFMEDFSSSAKVNTSLWTENSKDTSVANVSKGSVKERWLDWERERERLREMDRLEEKMKEAEDEEKAGNLKVDAKSETEEGIEIEAELPKKLGFEVKGANATHPDSYLASLLIGSEIDAGLCTDSPSPRLYSSGLEALKKSLMASVDKDVHPRPTRITTRREKHYTRDPSEADGDESRRETSTHESWENESLIRQANSSLPAVRHAVRNQRVAQDNNIDRMSIWIRNVEKIVADTRKEFDQAVPLTSTLVLPPLPVAPFRVNSHRRTQRVPRKILAANEIFSENGENVSSTDNQTRDATADNSLAESERSPRNIASERMAEVASSSSRTRRATVSGLSPENIQKETSLQIDTGSSSHRTEKSRSQGDLLLQPITPLHILEMELEKLSTPTPPLRLSAVVDRSLFITPLRPQRDTSVDDDLESSPYYVEPYQTRVVTGSRSLDSPKTKRRVEATYEQLITSTSGVKKVGLGYQSDIRGAVVNMPIPTLSTQRNPARRAAAPPISSEDWRKTLSVDELGMMVTQSTPEHGIGVPKHDRGITVGVVRRALNIMTGKAAARRLSRIV